MKLAISGKGGVGKTTLAAALVKSFAQTHQTVYAIDADPDASLALAVGIPEQVSMQIRPVVEMKELIQARSGNGAFYILNPNLDDVLEEYCYRHKNIRFFRMGGIKKGGSECYCRENSFLHAFVSSLLLDQNEVVIMDMGAGIEHLSRGTAKGVDLMLVVVEPSRSSINTAWHVQKLSADLGISRIKIIGNKIRSPKEREFIEKNFTATQICGFVKFDESIWESAMEPDAADVGRGFLVEVERIKENVLQEVKG